MADLVPTATHWGNYLVERRAGKIAAVHPYPYDETPTPIGQSLLAALDADCRIPQPMVRRGWLHERWEGDGSLRGREPFVAVSWDRALDLAAEALEHARDVHGNESIYGGSYGWASAGRFHHAQSQIHRFLNLIGGYTRSVTTYSVGAAEVVMPHVLGLKFHEVTNEAPTVADMVAQRSLVVCFGGIALKNTQVNQGGLGAHTAAGQLESLRAAGVDFVNISPVRDDMSDAVHAQWWPCRPNSDVAIMLGIAHTLVTEGLHDRDFLARCCTGFERFEDYLLGGADGTVKDAGWAAALAGIDAEWIRELARRMAARRSVIGISWSLQRSEHGEQTWWMATVLGAMLGYTGLPGGGVAYGYGSVHNIGFAGRRMPPYRTGAFPQGRNPVEKFIPVSRISDMLLDPGGRLDFNGRELTFPDIRVVYWAGGNPFHHHQDLNRLRRAWARPGTVIVNEPFWTATARHADIVFPCTTPLERNDLGASSFDCFLTPMRQVVAPFARSRNDFDIFSGLARRLGAGEAFTEGRDEMGWVEWLYAATRVNAAEAGIELPEFADFWAGEQISIAEQVPVRPSALEQLRTDPAAHPLATPSGRIEIFSETIDGYGYADCAGHPAWYPGEEWLGAPRAAQWPLHLVSNQPRTRLHSQYDHAGVSRASKIDGRERARMHPADAAARGIAEGDIVRVFNDRGACLAGVELSDGLREGVIELPTGAWYDPLDPDDPMSLEVHGNPNVLTRDVGTSRLAQGPTAHSCLVDVARFEGEPPPVRAFAQPATAEME